MNKIRTIFMIMLLTIALYAIQTTEAVEISENNVVKFQNSSDSFMRTYDEAISFGNISRGYFSHWSTFVSSTDSESHWVELSFHFDSTIQKQKTYVVPGYWNYVDASGYMKIWTNKVNITINQLN